MATPSRYGVRRRQQNAQQGKKRAAAAAKDMANEPKIEHAGRVEEKPTPVHTAAIDARLQITGISAAGTRTSDLHRRHCLVDGFPSAGVSRCTNVWR